MCKDLKTLLHSNEYGRLEDYGHNVQGIDRYSQKIVADRPSNLKVALLHGNDTKMLLNLWVNRLAKKYKKK